jgi:phosphoenolpyruvate carboxykinase (GTP)
VADFVKRAVDECKPANVHVVTGSAEESAHILAGLEKDGMVKRLPKYENW